MSNSFENMNTDSQSQMQGIFASVFILQNRLQTACEKIQTDISMKQWLLLAMVDFNTGQNTLTSIAELMGCSRQNIKQLAVSLEKKGYIDLIKGRNNAIHIQLKEKAYQYSKEMAEYHRNTLRLLFANFNDQEIQQLFDLYSKLYYGVSKIEEYVKESSNNEE